MQNTYQIGNQRRAAVIVGRHPVLHLLSKATTLLWLGLGKEKNKTMAAIH